MQPAKPNYIVPLVTITILFFMWGFITCMNDILIPYLKSVFKLSFFQAMLVQFCFFGAYFIGSLVYFLYSSIVGDPINKIGYKKGILAGIAIAALGCFLFYPAASLSSYMGALTFPHLRFGMLAMFCYVGGEVAVGSFIINFLELPEIAGFSESVAKNYLALYWGGAMMGRFLGAISLNQELTPGKRISYMLLAAVAVFLLVYAIVDLTFSQISFFLIFMLLNFGAFLIGRSLPSRTLMIFASVNILLLLSAIFNQGSLAMYSVLGIGMFNSIMFSNIYTLSISGLGKYTSQGSSLVVMAILGGAIVPILQGYLADVFGVQLSFLLPVCCYLVIVGYGIYCTKNLMTKSATPLENVGH